MKDLADILAPPVAAIINSSIRQGIVPPQWKESRIRPLPKTYPPVSVERDIRPIAITNSLAKICESFIGKFFNGHFTNHLDPCQFGCSSGRSTTHALLKITDTWFKAADDGHNITRVLFVDFRKAFDFINHNTLLHKFSLCNFPEHLTVWSMEFLQDRKQFVKLGSNYSKSVCIFAGSPQGTIAGPNNFKLLINDLKLETLCVKYVDDTTVSTTSADPTDASLQNCADDLMSWCRCNGMILNTEKTKEMVIYLGTKDICNSISPVVIEDKAIERVSCFKLLGVVLSSNLSWDAHVKYILTKVAKRFYCIRYLVRARINPCDIVVIYCSVIRSILEYACPVWHPGLSKKQETDIERVQKRCLKLIYPLLSYSEALQVTGLERLSDRRERMTCDMFLEIKHSDHPLHDLLPKRPSETRITRSTYPYLIPITKTTRYGRAFIPYCIRKKY